MHYSPLRYPGGKNKLSKFIAKICVDNNIHSHYVEPYAGGASVALYLLIEGIVEKITINDIDRSIYAFWHSVLKNTNKLCRLIEETEINIDNWYKAKQIQKNKKNAKLLELGFSTLFLNRTNRSGILNAGVIGGKAQNGTYKIDCRFNKKKLIEKIKLISKHKKYITLKNIDALNLIEEIKTSSNNSQTIFYFDPPYYLKGKSLYLNYYEHDDHKLVCDAIKSIKTIRWLVSYDDTCEIKQLYKGTKQTQYSFFHCANQSKLGNELLFFSPELKLPKNINPLSSQPQQEGLSQKIHHHQK